MPRTTNRQPRHSRICDACGRSVQTYLPSHGDGSARFFVRHPEQSASDGICSGSYDQAPRADLREVSLFDNATSELDAGAQTQD